MASESTTNLEKLLRRASLFPTPLSTRRRIADFFIVSCGLRRLHNTPLQRTARAVLDEIDLQQVRDDHPCRRCGTRSEMYSFVNSSIINHQAIDFLEFGVFRGDSIRFWTAINQHPDSRFYGFDSFEGLPDAWREGQGKGHFDVGGALPQIADTRVRFVKGWFDETVPQFAKDFIAMNRLLLHFDADLYSSTLTPLVYFKSFLRSGSLLIFDEFYDRDHEFKAFQDFLRLSRRQYRIVCATENYAKVCIELL